MNPLYHANSNVQKWGGKVEDYLPIHNWFDGSKVAVADARHRILRHHAFGIFEAEEKFGQYITNSDGKKVPVRLIGEHHVREDCGGRIPSVQDWVQNMRLKPWMNKGYNVHEKRTLGAHEDKTYELTNLENTIDAVHAIHSYYSRGEVKERVLYFVQDHLSSLMALRSYGDPNTWSAAMIKMGSLPWEQSKLLPPSGKVNEATANRYIGLWGLEYISVSIAPKDYLPDTPSVL